MSLTKTAPPQEDHSESVMPRSLPLDLVRREYELGRAQLEALARRLKELESQLHQLETTAASTASSSPADAGPASARAGAPGVPPLCDLIAAMVREVEAPKGIDRSRRSRVRGGRDTARAPASRRRGYRVWLIIAAGLLLVTGLLIWQLL